MLLETVRELVASLERFVRREAHALLRGPCRAREQTEDIAQDVLIDGETKIGRAHV